MDTVSPHADNGNIPEKLCTGPCGRMLPATTDFFHKHGKQDLQPRCKQCRKEEGKIYHAEHREERGLYASKYATEHREHIKLYKDKYNAEHREQHKIYLEEHKEIISEQQNTYYRENCEHLKQYSVQYRQTERGRMSVKAANHNRKARKKNAGGTHTAQELQEQFQRQKGKCYYCHKKPGKVWHADHVIPLSRGGSNTIDNIVIACPTCNQSKYNKLPHEWSKGGRLL